METPEGWKRLRASLVRSHDHINDQEFAIGIMKEMAEELELLTSDELRIPYSETCARLKKYNSLKEFMEWK